MSPLGMICFFDRITDYSDDNGRIRINDITMLFCSYVLIAEQYDIILLDHGIKIIKYGLIYRSDIVDRSVHPAICADRSELHSNSRPSGGTPKCHQSINPSEALKRQSECANRCL